MPGVSPTQMSRTAPPPTAVMAPRMTDSTNPCSSENALLAPASANRPTDNASAKNTVASRWRNSPRK